MQQDLNRVIEQVSKEKGIDKTILISALENAMVSAAKKTFGHQRKIEAQFNPEIGEVELFEAKTVVETVSDPAVEITLDEARENLDPDAQMGDELLIKARFQHVRAHCGASGQTKYCPTGARCRAGNYL